MTANQTAEHRFAECQSEPGDAGEQRDADGQRSDRQRRDGGEGGVLPGHQRKRRDRHRDGHLVGDRHEQQWRLDVHGIHKRVPTGKQPYLARAQGNSSVWSSTASTTGTVNAPGIRSPTIGSLSVSPNPVTQGDSLTLTANGVTDSDGTVVEVVFFLDTNGNGVIDVGTDILLGVDTSSNGGWSCDGCPRAGSRREAIRTWLGHKTIIPRGATP